MLNYLRAILSGGGLCALLDGICVTLLSNAKGIRPVRVWQAVASAVLGPEAFHDGWAVGCLGIGLHCLVAFAAATAFVFLERNFDILLRHPLASGVIYGLIVFVVMNMVVVPLSAMPKQPLNVAILMVQLVMHIALVGLPISLCAKYIAR